MLEFINTNEEIKMSKPLLEKLIQEIAMFDMVAACKLYERKDKCVECEIFKGVMVWGNTPEGHAYWSDINMRLEARREKYHPHRDLMIEYANDKTIEIEFLGDRKDEWKNIENPSFLDNEKYRKKPKVTKKVIEYRIYLDKENEIHMMDSKSSLPGHFKQWLGDWQNVEIEVEENN